MPRDASPLCPAIDGVLIDCFEQGKLPSEAAVPWAVAGTTVEIAPA